MDLNGLSYLHLGIAKSSTPGRWRCTSKDDKFNCARVFWPINDVYTNAYFCITIFGYQQHQKHRMHHEFHPFHLSHIISVHKKSSGAPNECFPYGKTHVVLAKQLDDVPDEWSAPEIFCFGKGWPTFSIGFSPTFNHQCTRSTMVNINHQFTGF